MPDIGAPELIIIALIVLLLFGPGKAADLGGALGRSIKEFRKASKEEDASSLQAPASTTMPSISAPQDTAANGSTAPSAAGAARFCMECGTRIGEGQKFCTNCGTPVALQTH